MSTELNCIRAYQKALNDFKKLERDLELVLEAFEGVRSGKKTGDFADLRHRVQRVELDTAKAYDAMESFRREYWEIKARLAEEALRNAAMPLVGAIEFFSRARDGIFIQSGMVALSALGALPRPPYALNGSDLPIEPLESSVLDRAEVSVPVLRGGLAI